MKVTMKECESLVMTCHLKYIINIKFGKKIYLLFQKSML